MKTRDPVSAIRVVPLADLRPDPENANLGTERGGEMLEESIRQSGLARGVVLSADNVLLAGNKTWEKAGELGFEQVIVVPTDGRTLVATQRVDVPYGSDAAKRIAVADNRVGQVNYQPDPQVLAQVLQDIDLSAFYSEREQEKVFADAAKAAGEALQEPEPLVLERYPLAIVLTHADWQRWQAHKKAAGLNDDTEALLRLLPDA